MPQFPRFWFWSAAAALSIGFAFTLFWFGYVDFYQHYFFEQGRLARHYEWARLAFFFYFAWLIYAAGVGVFTLAVGQQSLAKLPAWERYPLGFVLGAAVWSVPLYFAGLFGLYRRPLAVGVTLVVMAATAPHLATSVEEANVLFGRLRDKLLMHVRAAVTPERIRIEVTTLNTAFRVLLSVTIGIAVALFLLVKGLYPGGGHDYYNHYFPFYVRVVQTGSTLPNDVWYHFFLSKGDVLYFLAMLLTDPLAPQLVTAGFVACAVCIIYALLRRIAPGGQLPLIGGLLFILFFIYTPGPREFLIEGGWGDLEKEHELTAITILALIWTLFRIFGEFGRNRRPWIFGFHASIITTILVTLQLGFLIGLYLAGFTVWFAARRQWQMAAIPFFGGVTAATTIVIILALNYVLTGLILDQAILFTWPITNVAKLANWGPLFEALTLDKNIANLSAQAVPWSPKILWLFFCYLRLEIWWPLVSVGAAFSIIRLLGSRTSKILIQDTSATVSCALLWFSAVVLLCAAFGGGRSQSVSFYRLSSFSYAPTLCLGLALWQFGVEYRAARLHVAKKAVAISALAFFMAGIIRIGVSSGELDELSGNFTNIVRNGAAFWRGRLSVADAYQNQLGWPGRLPWGGIFPAAEETWRILPPHTRVWSFHVWTYCMLPNCNFQGFMSFIFSPQWRTVYFDTPELARAALHGEGLDYFFVSKDMRFEDPIVHAPLFSPDNVAKYLAVRWTDGRNYLLTWPGPNTRPLDESFLSTYRELADPIIRYNSFQVQEWRVVVDEITAQEAKGERLHPFPLPWCHGKIYCFRDRSGN